MAAIGRSFCRRPVCIALFLGSDSRQDHTFAEKCSRRCATNSAATSNTEAGRLYNVSASLVRQHQQGIFISDTRSVGFRVAMYWGSVMGGLSIWFHHRSLKFTGPMWGSTAWTSTEWIFEQSDGRCDDTEYPEEMNNVRVYKHLAKSTVLIASPPISAITISSRPQAKGLGSGVVIDNQKLIVTNAHVIAGAAKITRHAVRRNTRQLRWWEVTLQSDVALLQVTLPKEPIFLLR